MDNQNTVCTSVESGSKVLMMIPTLLARCDEQVPLYIVSNRLTTFTADDEALKFQVLSVVGKDKSRIFVSFEGISDDIIQPTINVYLY